MFKSLLDRGAYLSGPSVAKSMMSRTFQLCGLLSADTMAHYDKHCLKNNGIKDIPKINGLVRPQGKDNIMNACFEEKLWEIGTYVHICTNYLCDYKDTQAMSNPE